MANAEELRKARYNATKKAKDEKAKIKQALPMDGLLNFLEGGARPRAIVGGLLNGDTTALNGLLGEVKQLADPNYMRNVKGMSEQDAINIALDANPIMAGTMKGNIIDAIAPKTKYELAHELAQKNAVEMLGLPPNNTAMERAAAMGFDTPAYHGTSKDIQEFNTTGRGKTYDSGAFFTDNPSVAGTYTMGINDGNILPVMLKNEKHLNVDANGKNWNRLVKSTKINAPAITKIDNETEALLAELEGRDFSHGLVTNKKAFKRTLGRQFPDDFKYDDYFSTDELARWANKEGYGGATFNNVIDRGPSGSMANAESSLPSNNYAINNPANIRSRFAAFDPARRHEADILGMATPEMLGLLALGSGAGVAYANSRKDKKGNNK